MNASAATAAPRSTWMVSAGNFIFHWRNAMFPLVFLVAAASSKPLAPFGDDGADLWMDAVGLAIMLAGQALRLSWLTTFLGLLVWERAAWAVVIAGYATARTLKKRGRL